MNETHFLIKISLILVCRTPLLPHKSGYSAMTKTVSVCKAPVPKLLGVLVIAV